MLMPIMMPNPKAPTLKKTWFCECRRHCIEGGKYVQKRTYDQHAAIRQAEEHLDHAEHIRRFGASAQSSSAPPDSISRRRRKKQMVHT